MLNVEKLSFGYPHKELYQDISFEIKDGVHCAFIGTNGTGKSTLLNIIRNPEEFLYDGKMELGENCRIGYVSQFYEHEEKEDCSVFEYISRDFVKLEQEIANLCDQMATADDIEKIFEQYQNALDTFDAMDGEHYESNIKKQLKLARLEQKENLSVNQISGGEFKLVQIIKELMNAPSLVLMDEPDVFLDFEHLTALADLINQHKGTMLVITHNRFLLQHCFNQILHLENTEIQSFEGSYIEYNFLMLKNKIELQQLAAAEKEEIERQQKIVEKLRKMATALSNSSLGKSLHARVSLVERLEARKTKDPFVDIFSPNIQFLEKKQELENIEGMQAPILSVKNYHLAFEQTLLENVSFDIYPGEKIAIVGKNGTGKTTLLREIAKRERPEILFDEAALVGYLSQLQGETLNEDETIGEEFYQFLKLPPKEIEAYLAQYGFEGRMETKISALSGGEKNLLQIAKAAAKETDILILDEPTSHLDTYAQIALEDALETYKGAVLMVSHDFYTIVNCADSILYIEDKCLRKMSLRAFRKMIYANHFDKNYLELEQKKKELELRITKALQAKKFELAEEICDELEQCIAAM